MKKVLLIALFGSCIGCGYYFYTLFSTRGYITEISQECSQKEGLTNRYLCELMGLSRDKVLLSEDFDVEKAEMILQKCSNIKNAKVQVLPRGRLHINYDLHDFDCIIADFYNRGCSKAGVMFPIEPFFSKKKLLKVFLGIQEIGSEEDLTAYKEYSRFLFAQKVMENLQSFSEFKNIEKIDVSMVEEISLGKNQIVVQLQIGNRVDILRLSKRNYLNEFTNYTILSSQIEKTSGALVLDFRLEKCAFMKEYKSQTREGL